MLKIGLFSALLCSVLARSTKFRSDGSCGVQNVFEECPGPGCITRMVDEDNCMTCACNPNENRMGDMVLSSEAMSFILDGNRKGNAKGADPTSSLWNTIKEGEKFVIPYKFSSNLGSTFIDAIKAAISEIETKCCFIFRERTNETDYMHFFSGSGCFAPVGRGDGENRISIGHGCEHKGIVIHEIMHSLGFYHEHQRPDRDSYVKVVIDNIQPDTQDQFQIIQSINSRGSPYDYGSIMHYDAYAFARDNTKPTMTFANGSALTGIQETAMSNIDAEQIATLYNCQAPGDNTTVAVTATTTVAETTVATTATNTTQMAANTTTSSTNLTTTSVSNVTQTISPSNTTSVATTISNPPCVDLDSSCSSWAGLGFCTNPKYTRTVLISCPKSCNVCNAANLCFDKSGSKLCSTWKDFCGSNVHAKTNCKKTCGLC